MCFTFLVFPIFFSVNTSMMCLLHILNKTYILIFLRVIWCYSEPKLWHYVLSYVFALWLAPIAIYWLLWVVPVRVNLQGGKSKLSQEKWQRQMHQTHIIVSQALDRKNISLFTRVPAPWLKYFPMSSPLTTRCRESEVLISEFKAHSETLIRANMNLKVFNIANC